jgi:hypothetical protein
MRFYLEDDETDAEFTLVCPLGSPVPRAGETVQLHAGGLYEVVRVAYDYPGDGTPPEVAVTVNHF